MEEPAKKEYTEKQKEQRRKAVREYESETID